jgi:sarcosine oxidase
MYDVIVAGLGAVGSAAAWQCARAGMRVLGLDRFRPPHDLASHHGGSRVIRETAFEHPRYVPLVRRAYELWDELGAENQKRDLLIPTGALYFGAPAASVVTGSRASAKEHGVPCEELTADEITRRWPVFEPAPGSVGLLERRAGILRPESCVQAMLGAARGAGAHVRLDEPMLRFGADENGAWVETRRGRETGAHLIVATGAWMKPVLNELGVKAWVERVVQHWFKPLKEETGLLPAEMPIYLWQGADGVILYGFPVVDGVLKCSVHHRGQYVTVDDVVREVSKIEVEEVRGRLARLIPRAAGQHVRSAVCLYTNTPDGDFLIDRHPGHSRVLVASACSGIGFKFAPAVGEILSDLAAGKTPRFDLAPFSFARFLTK